MVDEQIAAAQHILPTLGSKVSLDNEYSSFKMNQMCKVCGEPAAGFHFGAFTCEGCKSFFGRTHSNVSQMGDCKNGGNCAINRKNRTSCKACRLRKCLDVGMSKNGSRYGRRSNWFKIHCLLQTQKDQNGGSDPDQDGDDGCSERTVSTPSSMKSGPLNTPPWNVSKSSSTSPTMLHNRDEKSESLKANPFMNPFFPGNPFLFPPGMMPMPQPMLGRDPMADMDHMRTDLLRLFLAYQNQNSAQLNPVVQKTPFIPQMEKKPMYSPLPKKRPASAVVEEDQEEPLDLSAKRPSSAELPAYHAHSGNVSPRSMKSSSESEDDEPADVEEHFRRSANRSSILDLSRK